jgi:single-strand DNA-binding protein
MNVASIIGRLVADPEIKYANNGNGICKFKVAVDRRYKKEGEPTADFIPCTAFAKTAEFIEKYFHKGNRIALTGSIQTGSYTNKDNQKVYTTEIIVDSVEFVESKSQGQEAAPAHGNGKAQPKNDDFMNVPDTLEDELPFS